MTTSATTSSPPVPAPDLPLLLSDHQVAAMAGISRRTVWSLVSQGLFPAPVKIPGLRMTRWRRDDIERWVDDLSSK